MHVVCILFRCVAFPYVCMRALLMCMYVCACDVRCVCVCERVYMYTRNLRHECTCTREICDTNKIYIHVQVRCVSSLFNACDVYTIHVCANTMRVHRQARAIGFTCMSHHHAYYVTSSCILCHIIITRNRIYMYA